MDQPPSHVSMTHSPNYYQSRGHLATRSSGGQFTPPHVRKPPAALLGHEVREYTSSPVRKYDPASRGTGSFSSHTTKSSIHSASPVQPQVYSPTLSSSSQAGRGSAERVRVMDVGNEHIPAGFESNQWQGISPKRADYPHLGPTVYSYTPEDTTPEPKDHAVWLLFWLSFFDPLYSLFGTFYTLLVMFPLLLVSPFNQCSGKYSLAELMIRSNSPILRLHLRFLRGASADPSRLGIMEYKASKLVLVNVIAPFLSTGVAIAAWISASFWVFALIMGNPDGTERRDDGKAAVLAVRDWWEKFLLSATK